MACDRIARDRDLIDDVSANRDLHAARVRGGHDQRLALGSADHHLPVDSRAALSGQRGSGQKYAGVSKK
jgi:hypothetical protein